jgi:hypothetical protein
MSCYRIVFEKREARPDIALAVGVFEITTFWSCGCGEEEDSSSRRRVLYSSLARIQVRGED